MTTLSDPPWFRATNLTEHDGDTVRMLMDNWFGSRQEESLRLAEVRAPEVGQEGWEAVRNEANRWMRYVKKKNEARRWPFRVVTEQTKRKPEPEQTRSFIRYIAYIYDIETGECLNEVLNRLLAQHPEWPPGKEV